MIKKTISLYPYFFPKIYSIFRSIILPVAKIESLLPNKGIVLDVGCGYGFTSIFFALKNKNRKIIGSEINSKRVLIAQKVSTNISNVSFKTSNLINQDKMVFNAILAIDLLHHINSQQKNIFLQDAFLKLKPNGFLIIKDIDTKPIAKFYWNYFHDLVMTKFSKLYFLSSLDMKNLLIKNNFKIIKQGKFFNFFYPHVYYVCQKKS